jgi:hypothetical protein
MLKKLLVTAVLIVVFMTTTGCGLFSQIAQVILGEDQSTTEPVEEERGVLATAMILPSATPRPTETVVPTATATKKPANTPTATEVPFVRARDITIYDEGQSIEVCGEVTGYEEFYCPECTNGFYAYLTLDDNFMVMSYEWTFGNDWVGNHIIVKDTVERMGGNPIFVYGGTEGWDGSECEINPNGSLNCNAGDYFQFVYSCN